MLPNYRHTVTSHVLLVLPLLSLFARSPLPFFALRCHYWCCPSAGVALLLVCPSTIGVMLLLVMSHYHWIALLLLVLLVICTSRLFSIPGVSIVDAFYWCLLQYHYVATVPFLTIRTAPLQYHVIRFHTIP